MGDIRRHRWPVEVYHEEGKAEGLAQYQLRDFGAIQRHVALVAVVYSLLRAAQHDPVLREQLQCQLEVTLDGSPAAWRRAAQAQSLWCLGLFISAGLAQGQSLRSLMAPPSYPGHLQRLIQPSGKWCYLLYLNISGKGG